LRRAKISPHAWAYIVVLRSTPSPPGIPELKSDYKPHFPVEPKLKTEELLQGGIAAKDEENPQVQFMEHEIECPRCHDSMELCSDFDSLYYVCGECDFCLYTIKKNK